MCVGLLFSCNHCYKNEFTIFYFCGDIEPYKQFECAELDSLCMNSEYDDTILVNSTIAEQIKDAILNAKSTNNYPKPRTLIMYVSIENLNLCLTGTDNQCWIKQDDRKYHPYFISNESMYLLKWKSKYYNYLPYDILELDKAVQKYGIPSDYEKVTIQR